MISTVALIPKVYTVEFSVKPTGFARGYRSVLHFTTGGDHGKLGNRIPGVWLYSNRLHICGSVNGKSNYCVNSKPLQKNKWANVRIVNSKVGSTYWYTVYVNGKQITKSKNPTARVYKNVKIYVSDPWYVPAQGFIRQLKVFSAGK